ncbi:lamin tail domain-containing protein [Corynebacterium callunae]|uniref:lamin tail domain-containing protein n=1 Tax=Corynebacterium callunae TaxID=1721 RepID=UPI003981AAEA
MNKRTLLVTPVVASLVFCNLAVANSTAAEVTTSPIVINEVESNGDAVGDFVELANTDTNNSVDLSGWSLVDENDQNPIVLPAGTEIESGGYFLIYPDTADISTSNSFGAAHFGLGKDDTVTLRDAAGNDVATYSWADLGAHADTTYGRVPDMTGEFTTTGASTPGLANIAGTDTPDDGDDLVANAKLPLHEAEVSAVALGGAFESGDMSGVDFDAEGNAWVVNNGSGVIYALSFDPATNTYTQLGQWQTTYAEGTGTLDAEGISVAANGDIYLATERNNTDKNASRPSILRFANPLGKEGTQVALHEWNLAEFANVTDANGGLEAIEELEENIFAVGVEETGDVLVINTAADAPVLVQRYESVFPGVMALDYNADSKKLSVICDEDCEGMSEILTWDGAQLTKADDKVYERPANLGNWANEGFAAYTSELECTDGSTTTVTSYLWADDAATNDFKALNSAQVIEGDCEPVGGEVPGDDEEGTTSSNNKGSTTFAAGSVVGSLATTLLAVVGIAGAIGGFVQQILNAFPELKNYIRF